MRLCRPPASPSPRSRCFAATSSVFRRGLRSAVCSTSSPRSARRARSRHGKRRFSSSNENALPGPLDRATHRGHVLYLRLVARQDRLERIVEVGLGAGGILVIGVGRPVIHEPVLGVEEEDLGGPRGAVGLGDLLRLVVEKRKGEGFLP